mgnify:CR=1 FL=1
MVYLLKVFSDMLLSPQPFSHFNIYPKPKVKLNPTKIIYLTPSSSLDIETARNPSHFGLTNRALSLTEMDCKLSVSLS